MMDQENGSSFQLDAGIYGRLCPCVQPTQYTTSKDEVTELNTLFRPIKRVADEERPCSC